MLTLFFLHKTRCRYTVDTSKDTAAEVRKREMTRAAAEAMGKVKESRGEFYFLLIEINEIIYTPQIILVVLS